MRCSFGQTWTENHCSGKAKEFNWDDAKTQSTHFAGYSDWRLPTIKELRTLVYCSNGSPDYFSMGNDFNNDDDGCEGKPDKDHKSPTILQSVFPNTYNKALFCSSSSHASYSGRAWIVNFCYGYGDWGNKYDRNPIRLVRSGQ